MKSKRKAAIAIVILIIICSCTVLSGCKDNWWEDLPDFSFSNLWQTTENGFVYYVDKEIGCCLLQVPEEEEITIPENIGGNKVEQLGYWYESNYDGGPYRLNAPKVKTLIIRHLMKYKYANFPNLKNLVFVDYLKIYLETNQEVLQIKNTPDTHFSMQEEFFCYKESIKVELRKGEKFDIKNYQLKIIEIPQYVTIIETGVFDGIENVIIKTPYEAKPEGWQDGWNSGLEVLWGAEL